MVPGGSIIQKKMLYVYQDKKNQRSLRRVSNLVWLAPRVIYQSVLFCLFFLIDHSEKVKESKTCTTIQKDIYHLSEAELILSLDVNQQCIP